MAHTYQSLTNALKETVGDLAYEAKAGDQDARLWLRQSFPAYDAILTKHWRAAEQRRAQQAAVRREQERQRRRAANG